MQRRIKVIPRTKQQRGAIESSLKRRANWRAINQCISTSMRDAYLALARQVVAKAAA